MTLRKVLLLVPLVLAGCDAKEGGGAKKAGQAVGETLTDFAEGVGKSIDKRFEVAVELSDGLQALGVSKTVSEQLAIHQGKPKSIAVYLLSHDAVNLRLTAKALNGEGAEVGRSVVECEFTGDDAKYVTFAFDTEMDTQLVEKLRRRWHGGER
jgi:hypothetical protein